MTLQKKGIRGTTPQSVIYDEVPEIPPALQQELDAMNSSWEAQTEEQRQRMEPEDAQMDDGFGAGPGYDQQSETDSLADYRIEILGKAAHIVSQDRNVMYGAPEDSFNTIANLWKAYLGLDFLLPTDVACMLALLKIARLSANPMSEDSWTDLAGYAACGASSARTLQSDATP